MNINYPEMAKEVREQMRQKGLYTELDKACEVQ